MRGAGRDRHERAVGCGGREACERRTQGGADGEAVWSRRPDAGVKFCGDDPQGDGGKKARFTRESSEETVKTWPRGECRSVFGEPAVT